MSTINKFTLLKHVTEDIHTIEAWVCAKESDLRIPPGVPRHIAPGPGRMVLKADIIDRKRQLHILKTMKGLAEKL